MNWYFKEIQIAHVKLLTGVQETYKYVILRYIFSRCILIISTEFFLKWHYLQPLFAVMKVLYILLKMQALNSVLLFYLYMYWINSMYRYRLKRSHTDSLPKISLLPPTHRPVFHSKKFYWQSRFSALVHYPIES